MADQELKVKLIPDLSEVESQLRSVGVVGGGGGGGGGASPAAADSSRQVLKLLGGIAASIGIIAFFWQAIGPILKIFTTIFTAVILTLLIPVLRPLLANLPTFFSFIQLIKEGIFSLIEAFKLPEALDALASGDLGAFLEIIFAGAAGIGKKIIDFVAANLPLWLGQLAQFGSKVIGWIFENAAGIFGGLLGTGTAMIDWIVANMPDIFADSLEIGAEFLRWVMANLPAILGKLYELGLMFLEWIAINMPKILGLLFTLGGMLLKFIFDHRFEILAGLAQLGGMLLNAIIGIIRGGLNVLFNLGELIMSAVLGSIGGIAQGIGSLLPHAQAGGFVAGTGLAVIHKGETITPAGGGGGYSPTFNISADVDSLKLKRVLEEHDRELLAKMRRQGSSGGRFFNV